MKILMFSLIIVRNGNDVFLMLVKDANIIKLANKKCKKSTAYILITKDSKTVFLLDLDAYLELKNRSEYTKMNLF